MPPWDLETALIGDTAMTIYRHAHTNTAEALPTYATTLIASLAGKGVAIDDDASVAARIVFMQRRRLY